MSKLNPMFKMGNTFRKNNFAQNVNDYNNNIGAFAPQEPYVPPIPTPTRPEFPNSVKATCCCTIVDHIPIENSATPEELAEFIKQLDLREKYLMDNHFYIAYRGISPCVLCGDFIGEGKFMTERFHWNFEMAHNAKKHNVAPDPEFKKFILSNPISKYPHFPNSVETKCSNENENSAKPEELVEFIKRLDLYQKYLIGLGNANYCVLYRGFMPCKLCGDSIFTREYITESFYWNGNLLHNAKKHNVAPDPEFKKFILEIDLTTINNPPEITVPPEISTSSLYMSLQRASELEGKTEELEDDTASSNSSTDYYTESYKRHMKLGDWL